MTLDEAIKELTILAYQGLGPPKQETKDALKLGIKALKRFRLYRYKPDPNAWRLLPGETED